MVGDPCSSVFVPLSVWDKLASHLHCPEQSQSQVGPSQVGQWVGLVLQAQDILTHLQAQTCLCESLNGLVEAQVPLDFPSGEVHAHLNQ